MMRKNNAGILVISILIFVTILGILAAIGVPYYLNMEKDMRQIRLENYAGTLMSTSLNYACLRLDKPKLTALKKCQNAIRLIGTKGDAGRYRIRPGAVAASLPGMLNCKVSNKQHNSANVTLFSSSFAKLSICKGTVGTSGLVEKKASVEMAKDEMVIQELARLRLDLAVARASGSQATAALQIHNIRLARKQVEIAAKQITPLLFALDRFRTQARQGLNNAYHAWQYQHGDLKQRVNEAIVKLDKWFKARQRFQNFITAAKKHGEEARAASAKTFEARQLASQASQQAQVQANIAKKSADEEGETAIRADLTMVLIASKKTEAYYSQSSREKTTVLEAYNKFAGARVTKEEAANASLEKLEFLWGQKLFPERIAKRLAAQRAKKVELQYDEDDEEEYDNDYEDDT